MSTESDTEEMVVVDLDLENLWNEELACEAEHSDIRNKVCTKKATHKTRFHDEGKWRVMLVCDGYAAFHMYCMSFPLQFCDEGPGGRFDMHPLASCWTLVSL